MTPSPPPVDRAPSVESPEGEDDEYWDCETIAIWVGLGALFLLLFLAFMFWFLVPGMKAAW